jgi:hypothetical protein
MGRRERVVPDGPLRDFALGLRALREAAGGPTYRAMAARAGFSAAALSIAANGERLPSLEVTLAYVGACGGDMAEWERRWNGLAVQLSGTPAPRPSSVVVPSADRPARRRWVWALAAAGAAAMLSASAVLVTARARRGAVRPRC